MPQLLLELLSEEIPARMQAQAARDLERMARERLAAAGFLPEGVKAFAGPRRLTLVADGLAPAQSDRAEERKGPRANAPDQAIAGFLRSAGLTRDQLVERDGVLFGVIHSKGRPTPEIVAEMVDDIVRGFPWPKSMKWGTGTLRWVRPLQRILCVFDGEVVPFAIDGLGSGDLSEGHRFMGAKGPFRAHTFEQYAEGLRAGFVVLDVEERKGRILHEARTLCQARNLELVEDEGLLDEVAGLAEWPVPILGDMDADFLDLPPEVIRTSMRTHQKYFAVRDPAAGGLAPHFITVANIEAIDGGLAIAAGNARVLSARLNDARFFWTEDRKVSLERRLGKLKGVTFHAKLGTMYSRVERIEALAREIAPLVGADPDLAAQAARLAKADLGTGMVGEFPELQGVMGGYYARAEYGGMPPQSLRDSSPASGGAREDGDDSTSPARGGGGPRSGGGGVQPALTAEQANQIADAIRDHYKPQGPGDSVPTAPVSVAVALADKLDTLTGFFAIDEKPTGSKDPYALRRAALGVIRTILDARLRLGLVDILELANAALIVSRTPPVGYGALARQIDLEAGDKLPEPHWFEPPILVWIGYEGFDPHWSGAALMHQQESPDIGFDPDQDEAEEYDRHSAYGELSRRLDALQSVPRSCEASRAFAPGLREFGVERSWLAIARDELDQRIPSANAFLKNLLAFFADRLKVLLREQGKRHDLVDAVFALGDDDLVRIVDRVEALDAFLKTDDGANLLAGYKRAVNILKAEEKKGPLPTGEAKSLPDAPGEETFLLASLRLALPDLKIELAAEQFTEALGTLAQLRAPVDAFFDKVLVNAEDAAVRDNRLRLLAQVRDAMGLAADFSLIAG